MIVTRFQRWVNDRRWFQSDPKDKRPYFDANVIFQATDMEEAEALFDKMLEAIGCEECLENEDKPCPHFRIGGLHLMEED